VPWTEVAVRGAAISSSDLRSLSTPKKISVRPPKIIRNAPIRYPMNTFWAVRVWIKRPNRYGATAPPARVPIAYVYAIALARISIGKISLVVR